MKILTALVADDDKQIRILVGQVLEHNGFSVELVSSGKEAMHAIKNDGFDLVVADNQMGENPNLWGVGIIKTVKSMYPQTKTILMSADEPRGHSANVFLLKSPNQSLNLTDLENAISELFKFELYELDVTAV